jgi:hypothetical protein
MKNVSLFKRKRSSSYLIQYTDDHGSRKILSTRCALKSDALRFLAALQAEQNTPRIDSKTLSAFTADFLAYAKSQYQPTTVAIYRSALSVLLTSVGNVSIDSITARHVWHAPQKMIQFHILMIIKKGHYG